MRANEASFVADKAKTNAPQAEDRHVIAEQENNDIQITYERLCKKQKAAFVAAGETAKD